MTPTKFYKKYIKVEKGPVFNVAYYDNGVDEIIYCNTYSKSYTIEEIKNDVIDELRKVFA